MRGSFRQMPPPLHGFRHWLLENYRPLYVLDLIVAYASLMLYFVLLVLIGRPSVASKIIFGIFVGSAVVGALPFAVARYRPEDSLRTALKTRRPKKTERMETIIAAVLWAFILIAFALLHSRIH